ncbi:MAG: hypothetical protein ACFFG0_12945 [Candidatus Thorarchaeota archaeon]
MEEPKKEKQENEIEESVTFKSKLKDRVGKTKEKLGKFASKVKDKVGESRESVKIKIEQRKERRELEKAEKE